MSNYIDIATASPENETEIIMLSIENTLLLVIDIQARLMPVIYKHEELEKKCETFIKGCRLLDVPVLTMQQYTKGLGETMPSLKEAIGEFEPIEKITFSCYGEIKFVEKLRESGKKNILIIGIESHICVQQTVLDLLEIGYNVYVIADCVGSRFETDIYYAQKRMMQAGAIITTAESALFELLKRADHPKRKEISGLVK